MMENSKFEAPTIVEYKGHMGAPQFRNMPQFTNMLENVPGSSGKPAAVPGTQLALPDARQRRPTEDDYSRLSEMVLYR